MELIASRPRGGARRRPRPFVAVCRFLPVAKLDPGCAVTMFPPAPSYRIPSSRPKLPPCSCASVCSFGRGEPSCASGLATSPPREKIADCFARCRTVCLGCAARCRECISHRRAGTSHGLAKARDARLAHSRRAGCDGHCRDRDAYFPDGSASGGVFGRLGCLSLPDVAVFCFCLRGGGVSDGPIA